VSSLLLDDLQRTKDQAKPELHFKFGAVAAESHFIPAFSQAD
jgi:hypothetical protein